MSGRKMSNCKVPQSQGQAKSLVLLSVIALSFATTAHADQFGYPKVGNDIVGSTFKVTASSGDELADVGRPYGIGGYEMIEANPQVGGKVMQKHGDLTIPHAYILPQVNRKGIVINLSELRLYYFLPNQDKVLTFPIGIGRQGWHTPVTLTKIVEKIPDPTWHVPASIKAWDAEQGIYLPDSIPPGPDNPLGAFAMRTALGDVLIHGTNSPTSVGWRVSSGCIRMLPNDIATLFSNVPVGTPVNIIDDPYKAGWHDGKLYLEAHLPVQENPARDDTTHRYVTAAVLKAMANHQGTVNWDKVYEVADAQTGIPTVVGEVASKSQRADSSDTSQPVAQVTAGKPDMALQDLGQPDTTIMKVSSTRSSGKTLPPVVEPESFDPAA